MSDDVLGRGMARPGRACGAAPLLGLPKGAGIAAQRLRWDLVDGGHERVYGTVTIERSPARRRVRLFHARDGRLLRETWSGVDGRYTFDYLAGGREFLVVAHDHTRQFNAVGADAVVAEPM